jgi:pyruvate formate lyase activating enzyme
VDWDGKVSSVVFLPNCNFRCPYCYNSRLVLNSDLEQTVPLEFVKKYLNKNRLWIDGVVISGGEPTIHQDLKDFCLELKKLDLSIKIDTNGTNPEMLKLLIRKGIVDYVALDVKAPLNKKKYSKASGVNSSLLENIRETIRFLLKGKVEYEFRTTIVPTLHKKEDIKEICREIIGCQRYALQNFKSNIETINPMFKKLKPFSQKEMEIFLKEAQNILPNTTLRT